MSEIKLSPKQAKAWELLDSPDIAEVFAGGGAGGGKSYLGCLRQIYRRTTYAGTRGFIGREDFTALRDSTMKTYFALVEDMGYRSGEHYTYNAQEHIVYFANGSEQHFRYMKYQPSDPDYNRFGSTEYTDAFVDEAPEVAERACQVLLSRLRYAHAKHGITKEILYTGNPGESWVKYAFVMDLHNEFIDLPEHRARVLFTIEDNPDLELRESYKKTLHLLDDYDKERLLYGDWTANPKIERPFAFNFNERKHVSKDAIYQQGQRVLVSVDFNVEPFCAIMAHQWRDRSGEHMHVYKEIEISNGSIEELAKQINANCGNVYNLSITGDAMGKNRRVKLKDADNQTLFTELRDALGISEAQMKIVRNPFHKESRANYNTMLAHYNDFKIHPSCTGLIRDHKLVEIDEHGSIKKSDRSKVAQRADYIDCFAAGTMIKTPSGDMRIEDISIGQMVLTDDGYRPVWDAFNRERDVYEFTFDDGTKTKCTKDHLFYTKHGYLPIFRIFEENIEVWKIQSFTRGLNTTSTKSKSIFIAPKETKDIQEPFIDKCGSMLMEKYRRAINCITKTVTPLTTPLKTLRSSSEINTQRCTLTKGLKKTLSSMWSFKRKESLKPLNGMDQKRVLSGTSNTQKTATSAKRPMELENVTSAERSMKLRVSRLDSAIITARANGESKTTPTWLKETVPRVESNIQHRSISSEHIAQFHAGQYQIHTARRVKSMRKLGSELVYDITVADRHNFYANGILVHNCGRYLENTFLHDWRKLYKRLAGVGGKR